MRLQKSGGGIEFISALVDMVQLAKKLGGPWPPPCNAMSSTAWMKGIRNRVAAKLFHSKEENEDFDTGDENQDLPDWQDSEILQIESPREVSLQTIFYSIK